MLCYGGYRGFGALPGLHPVGDESPLVGSIPVRRRYRQVRERLRTPALRLRGPFSPFPWWIRKRPSKVKGEVDL